MNEIHSRGNCLLNDIIQRLPYLYRQKLSPGGGGGGGGGGGSGGDGGHSGVGAGGDGRSGGGGGCSGGGGGAATCRSLSPFKLCICRFNASFLEKEPLHREQRNTFTLCRPRHDE